MKATPVPMQKVPALSTLIGAYPGLKGFFFDMDGTLFNTEGIHADAMMMIAKKYNIRPPYSPEVVHGLMMGKADHLVFNIIQDWEGVPKDWNASDFINEKNTNVIELLKKTKLSSYFSEDVQHLLKEAKEKKMWMSLVTSSEKLVTLELLKIAGLDTFFDQVLTRDDCPRHKPDPLPYLMAYETSGLDPAEVIIVEDSHVGLEAATSAGPHVIKVEWY